MPPPFIRTNDDCCLLPTLRHLSNLRLRLPPHHFRQQTSNSHSRWSIVFVWAPSNGSYTARIEGILATLFDYVHIVYWAPCGGTHRKRIHQKLTVASPLPSSSHRSRATHEVTFMVCFGCPVQEHIFAGRQYANQNCVHFQNKIGRENSEQSKSFERYFGFEKNTLYNILI